MMLRIYPQNPAAREVERVAEALRQGGVVVYPTDSRYALGCALYSTRGVAQLLRLCGKREQQLSIVCDHIARAATYCRIDNRAFRTLKQNTPGAFTFLLQATSRTPDRALQRRRIIGVRIPDHAIAQALVTALDAPLLSASLKADAGAEEFVTQPSAIDERYGHQVAWVIDGGEGSLNETTVVDLSGDEAVILREGCATLV
jgi:tRNA threonylcarbamoyl adenosine modification protein (Sua5/YciO/YrdC/YwlC family)